MVLREKWCRPYRQGLLTDCYLLGLGSRLQIPEILGCNNPSCPGSLDQNVMSYLPLMYLTAGATKLIRLRRPYSTTFDPQPLVGLALTIDRTQSDGSFADTRAG